MCITAFEARQEAGFGERGSGTVNVPRPSAGGALQRAFETPVHTGVRPRRNTGARPPILRFPFEELRSRCKVRPMGERSSAKTKDRNMLVRKANTIGNAAAE